jgi:hypothetical protein
LIGEEGGIKKGPKLYNTKSFEEKTSGTIKKRAQILASFYSHLVAKREKWCCNNFLELLAERERCCKRWRGGVSRPES